MACQRCQPRAQGASTLRLVKRQKTKSLPGLCPSSYPHTRGERAATLAFGSNMLGMDTPRSILMPGMWPSGRVCNRKAGSGRSAGGSQVFLFGPQILSTTVQVRTLITMAFSEGDPC